MDCVVSLVSIYLWDPIARPFNYLRSLNKNIEILSDKMEKLRAKADDVKMLLKRGKMMGKEPTPMVQRWLEIVERITDEQDNIQKASEEGMTCLNLPNYPMRLKLSVRAAEAIHRVEMLLKEEFFREKQNGGNTTANKTFERVWGSLMNDEIGLIGVYGMGGTGKTTMMQRINNRLVEYGHFDITIWVTVSNHFRLAKLQIDIAKRLNLDVSELGDEMTRAAALFEYLEGRKFLLILDDVWEDFSLTRVGIPSPNRANGSKLILTTRSWHVCVRMNCQETIKVESLSEEEAWELFKQTVGHGVEFTPEVERIAKLLVQECAGLQLAIVTVGRSMRGKDDIRDWRNALRQLKSSITSSMDDDLFVRLKFSYEYLSSHKVRECFLYCALYPEGYIIPIEQLINYWIAEGLIDDYNDREAEMDKGYMVLKELQDSSMLENVDGNKCVKMHDLIRDMAIHIASENERFIVKAGVELKVERKVWTKSVERISLMFSDIEALMDEPDCPRLSTLLLQGNTLHNNISHSFFKHMDKLRVLDLSHTEIRYLPDSLSDLENLCALFLYGCMNIKKIPSLSRLTKLMILNLEGTGIEALPQGMEEAVNLRYINLNGTVNLRAFPARVLLNLKLLEDLFMTDCGWKWTLNTTTKTEGNVEIEHIISLPRLATLGMDFEDLQEWMTYISRGRWKSLKSFNFVIGRQLKVKTYSKLKCSVKVVDCNLESSGVFPDNTQFLYMTNCSIRSTILSNLKDLKDLRINECDDMEVCINTGEDNTLSTLEELHLSKLRSLETVYRGNMPRGLRASLIILSIVGCPEMKNALPVELFQQLSKLEEIEVCDCKKIEEIAGIAMEENEGEITSLAVTTIELPCVKELRLEYLPKLRRICKGLLYFDSLRRITVNSCPELKKLPIYPLKYLEEICIQHCEKIEVIVCIRAREEEQETAEGSNKTITFPNLKNLQLEYLPELKRICERKLVCESLVEITVFNCPLLKRLPFSVDNIPLSLKKIEGGKKWWDALEWDDLNTKIHLQRFFEEIQEEEEVEEEEEKDEEDMIEEEEEEKDEEDMIEEEEEERSAAAAAEEEEEEEGEVKLTRKVKKRSKATKASDFDRH